MIALLAGILAVAKPILDVVYFNQVMSLLHEYEDVIKKLDANLAQWPNLDDQERGLLRKEKIRLSDALEKQAALIVVKPT